MTKARKDLICLDDTPYYHITTSCVRHSFLCGYDKTTDTDYEHRRQWIVERIRLLASTYSCECPGLFGCGLGKHANHNLKCTMHIEEFTVLLKSCWD